MNPCKTLLIVALGVMPGALLAKEPPASTGSCSPVFSEVDVKGDFKPVVTCGLPPQFFNNMTAELQKLHKDLKLSNAQMVSLVQATNVMLGTVYATVGRTEQKVDKGFKEGERKADERAAHLEQLIKELAGKTKVQPGMDLVAEAQQWKVRYEELLSKSQLVEGAGPRDKQVSEALDRLDLDGAAKLLQQMLKEQETTEKVFAARYFRAAQIELLRFRRQAALPYLEKAHGLQPDNSEMAFAFANALQEQNQFLRAAPVYEGLLARQRMLAQENPAAYRRYVATTLHNLANLYRNTQRLQEAGAAYQEALTIYRALAQENPAAYRPYVAMTLNNLAILYRDTQRLKEAEAAEREAKLFNSP